MVFQRERGTLGEKSVLEITSSLLIMSSHVQSEIDGVTAKWKHLACCWRCNPELKRVSKSLCIMWMKVGEVSMETLRVFFNL